MQGRNTNRNSTGSNSHPLFSDVRWLGRILARGLQLVRRHHPAPVERSPKTALPTGPFAASRSAHIGDLLLWVPRRIDSFLIDDLTGGFGYSHSTVDAGEVDVPTGKPVMVEVTLGQEVKRTFQDQYARRASARIPLRKAGVDAGAFAACILSRLGEQYDSLEALTLGEIDDPAKQVCSGLAAECLPETVRREIAKARRLGLLRRTSVSVHSSASAAETKVFISPNGFAQYFGAPKGRKLREPDLTVEPCPIPTSAKAVIRKHGWRAGLLLGAIAALAAGILVLVDRWFNRRHTAQLICRANRLGRHDRGVA